jgi:hypothetical protein
MITVENLATLLAVITIFKVLSFVVVKKSTMNRWVNSLGKTTALPWISLAIGLYLGYKLLSVFTIVEMFAVALVVFFLIGFSLSLKPKEYVKFAKALMMDKDAYWKGAAVWLLIAIWVLYVLYV